MRRNCLVLALGFVLAAPAFAAAPAPAQSAAAQPSRWWGEVDRLGGLLDDGKWAKVEKQASALRETVMHESWREPDLAQVFAEIAFQITVAAAEQGDDERAVWEWHSALAHERFAGRARGTPIAERALAAAPRAAALFAEHPLRLTGEYPPGSPPVEPRPDDDFRPATAPSFQVAPLDNFVAAHEAVAPVHFEVFVAPDGRISQPVVVTDWSNPVVVQWGLDGLRASSRFEPAVLDGEPVGWLAPVELTLSNRPPKRW